MPRRLKPREVKVVQDRITGYSIPLFFDRNSDKLDFFGQVGDKTFRAPSAAECEIQIRGAIKAAADFFWFPVITVHKITRMGYPNHEQGICGYYAERFWLAKRPGAEGHKYIRAEWEQTSDEARLKGAHSFHWTHNHALAMPFYQLGTGKTYLSYADELWEGLCTMMAGLEVLGCYLNEQLQQPEGLQWLSSLRDIEWVFSIAEG